MQWHPLFAHLLRPVVEPYYELQTNVPVGDVPREADIVLLRRRRKTGKLRGIWKRLTPWNVLEFKGPTVTPRREDLHLLVEVGLGIFRRVSERQAKGRSYNIQPRQVSFWYLANRLGKRFWSRVRSHVGEVQSAEPGVWRCEVLGHPVYLVSRNELRIREEHLPLHIVSHGAASEEREVADLVARETKLRRTYSQWLFALHRKAWNEVSKMANITDDEVQIDLEELIDYFGWERFIAQVGIERLVEQVGIERLVEQVGMERLVAQVGMERLLKQVPPEQLVEHLDVDSLTPAQRRALKRRLG